jgi:hypothetical protein
MSSHPRTAWLERVNDLAWSLSPGDAEVEYELAEPEPIPAELFSKLIDGTLARVRLPARIVRRPRGTVEAEKPDLRRGPDHWETPVPDNPEPG